MQLYIVNSFLGTPRKNPPNLLQSAPGSAFVSDYIGVNPASGGMQGRSTGARRVREIFQQKNICESSSGQTLEYSCNFL